MNTLYRNAKVLSASTAKLAPIPSAIICNTTGTVNLTTLNGSTVTLTITSVSKGLVIPLSVVKYRAGGSVTGVVGLYH